MFTSDLIEKLMVRDVVDSEKEAKIFLETLFETLTEALNEKEEVRIRNFGKFYTLDRDERQARHPKTGETITVPPRSYVRFKSSKRFKSAVN